MVPSLFFMYSDGETKDIMSTPSAFWSRGLILTLLFLLGTVNNLGSLRSLDLKVSVDKSLF